MSEARDDVLDLSAIREHNDPEAKRAQRRTLGGKLDLFEIAELAEMTVADIYTLLSRRLHRDPELRALFALAASEEHAHARRVGQASKLWREKRKIPPADLDTTRVRQLLAEAQNSYDELENNEYIDEHAAMKASLALETSFERVYAEEMAQAQDPILAGLFSDLSHHDRGHQALLARGERVLYRR